MLPADLPLSDERGAGAAGSGLDEESHRWMDALGGTGRARDEALGRLHDMLLRVSRSELGRRRGRHPITGPELDDLAHQAADDALVAITAKLSGFRGESRFTTWAYKFVVFEVSAKLGRHFWQRPTASMDVGDWERLADRFGVAPDEHAQRRELIGAVQRAVSEELTPHQQQIFVALVVDGIPLDALVLKLRSNRNAIYKTMFDARRKLRGALVANGYVDAPLSKERPEHVSTMERRARRGRAELERFLRTDPRDVGCAEALRILHLYVDLVREDRSAPEAARRYPGVVAHLRACGPCGEDFDALLLATGTGTNQTCRDERR